MAGLKLKRACRDDDRARPLIEERVRPQGIDLEIDALPPRLPWLLDHCDAAGNVRGGAWLT